MGESDPRLDQAALEAARANHGGPAALLTIPRGGYWLPEERPDPVAAAPADILRGCAGNPPRRERRPSRSGWVRSFGPETEDAVGRGRSRRAGGRGKQRPYLFTFPLGRVAACGGVGS